MPRSSNPHLAEPDDGARLGVESNSGPADFHTHERSRHHGRVNRPSTVHMSELDLDIVRPHFPALRSGWAYFDNAGGSLAPQPLIDAVRGYMESFQMQLGASYGPSRRAEEAVRAGQSAVSTLFGVERSRLLLGPSTTMNVYVLAQALAEGWREGDEVIISELDHEANRGAWAKLAQRGIKVRSWPLNRATAALDIADLRPLLNPRTQMVCFTHSANVVGEIIDVPAVTRIVHEAGARVCVDGVAYAPHRALEIDAWDADIYLLSLYKTFGPHLGLAIVKPEILRAAAPQNHFFITNADDPYKLQPGNINHELVAGLVGTLGYFRALAQHHLACESELTHADVHALYGLMAQHEARLVDPLLRFIEEHPRARLLGPNTSQPDRRVALAAFTAETTGGKARAPAEIVAELDAQRVAIRHGDFYARVAMDALNLQSRGGILRVSMAHYNSPSEVQRLLRALDRVL